DIHTIEDELILKDLETLEKREKRLASQARSGDKEIKREFELCEALRKFMEQGHSAKNYEFKEEDEKYLKEFFLITSKPILYICNVEESEVNDASGNNEVNKVKDYAEKFNDDVILVCAKIEAEIAELDQSEKAIYLEELGIESSGLDKLIRSAYSNLGLITYFTAGPKEARAWTITKETKAPQAAGVIHTDFEKGFIRAETIAYNDYVATGSESAARDAGKMRSEGKEYTVKDGDVMLFRFNV
ncbi:MAG: DUF933 domain-containing protein, partial [Thermodesulfobacteriota bacterium]